MSDPLSVKRQGRMNLCDHGGTFADGRCNAFGRARADVTNREDAGNTGLQRQYTAAALGRNTAEVFSGPKKSFLIRRGAVLEPRRIGLGTNE